MNIRENITVIIRGDCPYFAEGSVPLDVAKEIYYGEDGAPLDPKDRKTGIHAGGESTYLPPMRVAIPSEEGIRRLMLEGELPFYYFQREVMQESDRDIATDIHHIACRRGLPPLDFYVRRYTLDSKEDLQHFVEVLNKNGLKTKYV